MKTCIIIPTYNEKENILHLIPALQNILRGHRIPFDLLIVDDSSPDGTADVVKDLMTTFDNVHLITGKKEGLGSAYVRGMTYATKTLFADAVMEMDADFSHKPEDVPRLIKELDSNDFVIGSRYVKGGSIPREWGLVRRMNSLFGNICARFVAGIYGVKDCTAGFRAIKRKVIDSIDISSLDAKGYCFQISLLHEAIIRGARVKEIPVDFIDRTHGESKLGIKDIIEFLYKVWTIRLATSKTFIKFLIVGSSGLFVNIGSMTVFLSFGMNKYIASPISIELSIVSNFFLNNYWTFAARKTGDAIHLKGLKFNVVSILSLAVSYGTFIVISSIVPDMPPQIPQALGIIPATLVNYFLNSYWTFKRQ